jgi:hypothetical protein
MCCSPNKHATLERKNKLKARAKRKEKRTTEKIHSYLYLTPGLTWLPHARNIIPGEQRLATVPMTNITSTCNAADPTRTCG